MDTASILDSHCLTSDPIPDSLKFCRPPVIYAKRHPHPRKPQEKAWLIITLDPAAQFIIAGERQTMPEARVYWTPKAGVTVRWCRVFSAQGPDCLHKAARRAAQEELEGPDSSVTLRPPVRRSTRPRDVQRKKAYRWENALFRGAVVKPRADIVTLIHRLCNAVGEVPPTIGARAACGNADARHINLAPSGLKEWIACHELAHTLAIRFSQREGKTIAGHGPEWLAVYCGVLAYHSGKAFAGFKALRGSAQAAGLKVGDLPRVLFNLLAQQAAAELPSVPSWERKAAKESPDA